LITGSDSVERYVILKYSNPEDNFLGKDNDEKIKIEIIISKVEEVK